MHRFKQGKKPKRDKKDNQLPVTRYISKYFPPTVSKNSIDWKEYEKRYDEVQRLMKESRIWFEDGHNYNFKEANNKKIALGRIQFYLQFADFLFEEYGERFYLLDYMARIEVENGQESLLYYITSADQIEINLEGVSLKHLKKATIGLGRLAKDKYEIGATYTTAWEINQVFHRRLIDKTTFHTGSRLSRFFVFMAMGGIVPLKRIVNDNCNLLKEYYDENKDVQEIST